MHLLWQDESVIGRAFYLKGFVKGRVLWESGSQELLTPSPHTTQRVRSGRFNKLACLTKAMQPRIRQCLLHRWGSRHVPVAMAADTMLAVC